MAPMDQFNIIEPSTSSAPRELETAVLPGMAGYMTTNNPWLTLTRSSSSESNVSTSETTPLFIGAPLGCSPTEVVGGRRKTKALLRLSFPGCIPLELHTRQRQETVNSDQNDSRSSHYSVDEALDRRGSTDESQTWELLDQRQPTVAAEYIFEEDSSPTLKNQSTFGRSQQSSGALNLDNPQNTFMLVRKHTSLAAETRTAHKKQVLAAQRDSHYQDDDSESIGNILNLFPRHPSRDSPPSNVTTKGPPADISFPNWLKFVEARSDARQAMIKRKQAQLELRNPSTRTASEATSVNLRPETLSHSKIELDRLTPIYEKPKPINIDFSSFDMRAPDALIRKEIRPLDPLESSTCSLLSSDGGTALCHDTSFTAQEERTERKIMLDQANLMEAQRCIVKDERGEKRSFQSLISGRRTVVLFVRFFWCALCQTYVKRLSKLLRPGGESQINLKNNDTRIVVVGTGNWKMITGYREMLECPFEIFTDSSSDKELFKKMGLNRSMASGKNKDRGEYLSEMNMRKNVIQSIKSIGKMPLRNPGHFSQLGGEFCFENLSLKMKREEERHPTLIQKSPILGRKESLIHGLRKISRQVSDHINFDLASPALTLESNYGQTAKCIYANRMTTSRNHGDLKELFNSIGIVIKFDSPEQDE